MGWARLGNRPVYSRIRTYSVQVHETLWPRPVVAGARVRPEAHSTDTVHASMCRSRDTTRWNSIFFLSYKRFDIQSRRTTSARSNENGNKTYKTRTLIEAINTSYCRYRIWAHDCTYYNRCSGVIFFENFSVHFVHNFSPERFSREPFCRLITSVKFWVVRFGLTRVIKHIVI